MKKIYDTDSISVLCKNSAYLHWESHQDTDFEGYRVYIGHESRRYIRFENAGKKPFFILDDLQPGNTYYFAVTTLNRFGHESDFSEEIVLTVPHPFSS